MEYTSKSIIFWLYACLAGIVAMVLLGGLTRLSDSGLSITEWEVFRGAIPPLSEAAWIDYFEKYKQIPEYQQINKGMSLLEFEQLFWLEWLHRFMGRLMGVVFFAPFLFFWATGKLSRPVVKKLAIIFALGALQGFFGWFMVSSGLSERTDVSQYRLALHLLTAFLIYALLLKLLLQLKFPHKRDEPHTLLKYSRGLTYFIFFMVFLGALVAGTDAGFIYTSFPYMGEGLIPSDIYALKPLWVNHFENPATIQFQHRVFAVALFIDVIVFSVLYVRYELTAPHLGYLFIFAVVLQACLGIGTLHAFNGLEEYFAATGYKKIFQPAVIVAQLHQLGALFLLSVNLVIVHRLRFRA